MPLLKEREQGIGRHMLPVDEVVDDKVAGLERQDVSHHVDVEFDFLGQPRHLRDVTEIVQGIGFVLGVFLHVLIPGYFCMAR